MNSSSSSSSSTSTHNNKHKYSYDSASTTTNLKTPQHHLNKLKKRTPQRRNPLKDLNNGGGGQTCTELTSSIKAPKGCLRFLHSSSSSSCYSKTPFSNSIRPAKSKTPKSAPKCAVSDKPFSQLNRFRKNPNLKTGGKSKKYSALDFSGNFVNSLPSGCRDDSLQGVVGIGNDRGNDSTPVTKIIPGNDGDNQDKTHSLSSDTKTPPLQASLSPEIQHNQSELLLLSTNTATTTTPACYGAGHVMSGVSDKRKCRPRGLLTVGEDGHLQGNLCNADSFNVVDYDSGENGDGDVDNKSSVGLLPLPAEASVHWLLSPCNEEDEKPKENSEKCDTHHSPSLFLSGHGFSSDLCDTSDNKNSHTICNRRRRGRSSLLAPSDFTESPELLGFPDKNTADPSSPDIIRSSANNSPLSVDSLGSGNVILTPQSDSSLDRRVGLSPLNAGHHKKDLINSQLNLEAEYFQLARSSSKSHLSLWDPIDSSFQFDSLATSSNLIDLSHFHKFLEDRTSWLSNSTMENTSQSDLRISWREGLASRIFDMDEEVCCRCLTDEEDNVKEKLKSNQNTELNIDAETNQTLTKGFGSTEFTNSILKVDGKSEEKFPPQNECSLAESISTDGGGLNASGDSDWSLCYNNGLFKKTKEEILMDGLIPLVYNAMKNKNRTRPRQHYECLSSSNYPALIHADRNGETRHPTFNYAATSTTTKNPSSNKFSSHKRQNSLVDLSASGNDWAEEGPRATYSPRPIKKIVRFRSRRMFSCVGGV